MMVNPMWIVAVLLAAAAGPAQAAVQIFSGTGTLSAGSGSLPVSGLTPPGSVFTFSFEFDTDAASQFGGNAQSALYEQPVSNFSASLGSYTLPLASGPGLVPVVQIGRGFAFLGGMGSVPVLNYAFFFPSVLVDSGAATPFILSDGSRITLSISAQFVANGTDTALGLDQIVDPGSAVRTGFDFSARDVVTGRSGSLRGSYAGTLVPAAAIPEPSTWLLLIGGFAIAGMRLRRTRRASPA